MNFFTFVIFAANSPFYEAYVTSDYLGKLIYLSLIGASICCWGLLIHKVWVTRLVERNSADFFNLFQRNKSNLLQSELDLPEKMKNMNPFYDLFNILKRQTKEILSKNHRFGIQNSGMQNLAAQNSGHGMGGVSGVSGVSGASGMNGASGVSLSYLSTSDIDYIEAHLIANVATQTKNLEKNLFILSTIVGLGPLLGLLGTVWGILITFSEMQSHTMGASNQMVLGGLSLALTTTVLGLLTAIPALIAYNYLKNQISNYQTEMENFVNEILSTVEIQYRKVDSEVL